jgi:predicted transposase YbfD/YdcC
MAKLSLLYLIIPKKQATHMIALACNDAPEGHDHWTLWLDEDSNRIRKGHNAANLAVIRHIVLNLVKAEKTSKIGVKIKRLKAGWGNDYLLRVTGVI